MTLPGYDEWLERPYTDDCHDCPGDPDDCTCEQDAADEREADMLARGEEQADYERGHAEDARVER